MYMGRGALLACDGTDASRKSGHWRLVARMRRNGWARHSLAVRRPKKLQDSAVKDGSFRCGWAGLPSFFFFMTRSKISLFHAGFLKDVVDPRNGAGLFSELGLPWQHDDVFNFHINIQKEK